MQNFPFFENAIGCQIPADTNNDHTVSCQSNGINVTSTITFPTLSATQTIQVNCTKRSPPNAFEVSELNITVTGKCANVQYRKKFRKIF